MRLFVPTMDAFLVEFDDDGRIRFDNEDWSTPSVQERRAIIHAAKDQIGPPEGTAGRAGE